MKSKATSFISLVATAAMATSALSTVNAADPAFDIERARRIQQKSQAGEALTTEETEYLQRARQEMQRRSQGNQKGNDSANTTPVSDPKIVAALVPLDELQGKYKGEEGGLYGGGRNTPPPAHLEAYLKESGKIRPLDENGNPSDNGKIVLLSLGMSNTTMEYSQFVTVANRDAKKSPNVVPVDGAIGARTAVAWALDDIAALPPSEAERLGSVMKKMGRAPKGMGDTWSTVETRLKNNGVTTRQVQALWIKQAEAMPAGLGEFPEHARTLENDVIDMITIAKKRYPNLRVVYLSSRIFGGYATTRLNPEPYAYEGAFSMRWIIQEQIKGNPRLNFDPVHGEVTAPIVVWGPYLWANGKTPRKSDGFMWAEEDLVPTDHTHPSNSARQKVASLLLNFFTSDLGAKQWFVKP